MLQYTQQPTTPYHTTTIRTIHPTHHPSSNTAVCMMYGMLVSVLRMRTNSQRTSPTAQKASSMSCLCDLAVLLLKAPPQMAAENLLATFQQFFLPIFSCWAEVRENTGENNRFCFNQVCIIGPRLDPAECGAANTINNSAAQQLQSQVSWEQHNTQKTHRWHCSSLQLTPPCSSQHLFTTMSFRFLLIIQSYFDIFCGTHPTLI